jgi:hypothetical protein
MRAGAALSFAKADPMTFPQAVRTASTSGRLAWSHAGGEGLVDVANLIAGRREGPESNAAVDLGVAARRSFWNPHVPAVFAYHWAGDEPSIGLAERVGELRGRP